jgi:RNA polymerase subunit RPABC4/transcription elongation factor Spt4
MTESVFCGNCGLQLSINQRFCPQCGMPSDPGINSLTLLNSEAQTICISCGHPRKPDERKCPVCNSQAPTMPAWNTTMLATLPANVATPPLIIKSPTEEEIHQAVVADTNPYAPWGKPAPNGSARRILQALESDHGKYIGSVFRLDCINWSGYKSSYSRPNIALIQGGPCPSRSFTFQALVRQGAEDSGGGLIFQSDSEAESYYAFVIDQGRGKSPKKDRYAIMTETEYHVRDDTCFAIRHMGANLLGVVAQEPGVLDMYINLVHVTRIYDSTLIDNGFLGVCAFHKKDLEGYMYISHLKVWIK